VDWVATWRGNLVVRHIDSLVLVWRIAELEAIHLGSKQIEPPHLFIGLLKVVDLDIEKVMAGAAAVHVEGINREVQSLRDCFGEFVLDATRLRRRLRRYLGKETSRNESKVKNIRRSSRSREVFSAAESLADKSEGIVHPLHLLAALLQHQDSMIEGVLEEVGCFPTELRRYTIAQLSKLHRV
jgi:ATP-dependent Clp protease ATP-binding subunit ClpC